jgi:hypothetical protein
MHHVIGLSSNYDPSPLGPLDITGRIRFDSQHFQSLGYFDLLAPYFAHYAQRDCGSDIRSLNVMFCLAADDLSEALGLLEKVQGELAAYPENWRTFLGTVHHPGQPPQRIEPLLFRSRAMAIVSTLKERVSLARAQGKRLVYGNGVAYRHLCGIRLPPGVVEYS